MTSFVQPTGGEGKPGSGFSLLFLLLLAAVFLLVPEMAEAGSGGAEFKKVYDKLEGGLKGVGGKVIVIISVIAGLAGMSVRGWSFQQALSVIGVGAGVSYGLPIVTSGISGTL